MTQGKLIFTMTVMLWFATPAFSQAPVSEPDSIDERLRRIEQSLQNQGLLEMLQQLERLQQEVSSLRGEIEVQNHSLEQLQVRQRALYTDLDQRMQGLEGNGIATTGSTLITPDQGFELNADNSGPPLQTLSPTTGPTTQVTMNNEGNAPVNFQVSPVQQTPVDIADLTPRPVNNSPIFDPELNQIPTDVDPFQTKLEYDQAFSLLKQSQYEQAIRAFREYLAKYPVSDYSDNAQYWLGEAFYVMRQFELASNEYTQLVNNYPESQKYTHALLKIGYSLHELGQFDEAKRVLDELQLNYPRTTASRLAEERLTLINAAIKEREASAQEIILQPN
jgi:tol-pal system protein YbgF